MQTKGCCKGNNYEQRFALETFPADLSWRSCSISWHPFSPWHNPSSVLLMAYRKSCILLFTLQQDCNTRKACRLFKLFSLLSRPLFHPHYISSHIIARVRTAAHPIAQRGRREAITLHSETLTARRETKNPSRQGRAAGGRASQSKPEGVPKTERSQGHTIHTPPTIAEGQGEAGGNKGQDG